ncbi:hypothetical protein Tco_1016548 [Tanacetum coccineum]|uniref:Uncharacterized protein n=1 Tax=Tanacetum coccineum TaxID=301880 RepID=A0ABQ5FNZ5_9ASTR
MGTKVATVSNSYLLRHCLRGGISQEVGTPRYLSLVVPLTKVGDEAVHKELGDRMERDATTASSLEAEQDSGDVNAQTRFEITSIQSIDPPLSRGYTLGSGEDSMKLIGIDEILELTNDEVEYLKLFEEEIEVRLKHRNQMRRWEMYVNGSDLLDPQRERPEKSTHKGIVSHEDVDDDLGEARVVHLITPLDILSSST